MRTSSASRFTVFSVLAALSACGQTLNVGSRGAGGSSAGEQGVGGSVGGNVGETSDRGDAPTNQPKAGNAVGGGAGDLAVGGSDTGAGAPGAGGEHEAPAPGYGITFIEPLPAPTVVPETVHAGYHVTRAATDGLAGSLGDANGGGRWVSADGSLVIGVSATTFTNPGGPVVYEAHKVFSWTGAGGTRPMPGLQPEEVLADPGVPDYACVAEDGSAAILMNLQHAASAKMYRWTPQGGVSALALPEHVSWVGSGSCSAHATRRSLLGSIDGTQPVSAYFWELGKNNNAVVPVPLPGPILPDFVLSRDGRRGVLSVETPEVPGQPIETRVYAWTAEEGTTSLGNQAEGNCFARLISGDGNVIVGKCSGKVFRWSPTSFDWLRQDFDPYLLSRDGRSVWGVTYYRSPNKPSLVSWTDGALNPELPIDTISYQLLGAVDSGNIAYVTLDTLGVMRWTPGALEALPGLPGAEVTALGGFSTDGSLAVGSAWPDRARNDGAIAVLWDAQGARDILKELTEAHVDMRGAQQLSVSHVWVGDTIRVLGYVAASDQDVMPAFIAELPRR